MIKCSCGKNKCPNTLSASGNNNGIEFWIEHDKAKDLLIYLDPNGVVALIQELRKALNNHIERR